LSILQFQISNFKSDYTIKKEQKECLYKQNFPLLLQKNMKKMLLTAFLQILSYRPCVGCEQINLNQKCNEPLFLPCSPPRCVLSHGHPSIQIKYPISNTELPIMKYNPTNEIIILRRIFDPPSADFQHAYYRAVIHQSNVFRPLCARALNAAIAALFLHSKLNCH